MSGLLRVYAPEEAGRDGYPLAWSRCPTCGGAGTWAGVSPSTPPEQRADAAAMLRARYPCPDCEGAGSIKGLVRQRAGHRCIRCGHPYVVGSSAVWEPLTVRGAEFVQNRQLMLATEDAADVITPAHGATHGLACWSACDDHCAHAGPVRWQTRDQRWVANDPPDLQTPQALRALSESGSSVQASWRILTVHHATGDKLDCRWWNLLALCQRCHLQVQGKVNMARVYPWEHSAWFKPYVAAWYALQYEGREITRAEAEADVERLLALERMA